MSPEFFLGTAVKGAMRLLPPVMDSNEAKAMILAICLQESKLQFRRQIGGPARGYAQFESGGGVVGVLTHPSSASHARVVCAALDVAPTQIAVYGALEQNDILAAAFARLLLWTLPARMPGRESPDTGWQQYISAWRPGKPHRDTWNACYKQAWDYVEDAPQQPDVTKLREVTISFLRSLDEFKS